jgi:hypothetical protein
MTMPFRIKAICVRGDQPDWLWIGPEYPTLGAAADAATRLRFEQPADDIERALYEEFPPSRWTYGVDIGPPIKKAPPGDLAQAS